MEIATFGGYTFAFGFHEATGMAFITSGAATAAYNSKDLSFSGIYNDGSFYKKHTPDQQAISELTNTSGKKGVPNVEADTLLEWSKEYDFSARDDRGQDHWVGGEHIHIGPKHVPVNN